MIAENEKDDTKKGSRDREKVCRKKKKKKKKEPKWMQFPSTFKGI